MRVRQLNDSPICEKIGEVPTGPGHGPTAVGAYSGHEEESMRATTLHVTPSRLDLSWTLHGMATVNRLRVRGTHES